MVYAFQPGTGESLCELKACLVYKQVPGQLKLHNREALSQQTISQKNISYKDHNHGSIFIKIHILHMCVYIHWKILKGCILRMFIQEINYF